MGAYFEWLGSNLISFKRVIYDSVCDVTAKCDLTSVLVFRVN